MAKLKLIYFACFSSLILSGCASVVDAAAGLGMDKPENAGPGYASFREGLRFERENQLDTAKVAFCASAELGNPKAAPYCEKYSLLQAAAYRFKGKNSRLAESEVCGAKSYGPTAAKLCVQAMEGKDIASGLADYVRALQASTASSESQASQSAGESAPKSKAALQSKKPSSIYSKDFVGFEI